MKIEATLTDPANLAELVEHGTHLEEVGFDSILVPEAGHDPFLPLMTLSEHTERPMLGTGIAIAFPRSPFVTAQLAWDLQRFSGGRFILGLGTQVKGHNVRRYSTPWDSPPGPRLREYVQCLRAIFDNFQHGTEPSFEGEHYRFTLNTPFFNPGPIEGLAHPGGVPIYLAGVNRFSCSLAGEVGDGLRMHPLNTRAYLDEVIRPAVEQGARRGGRDLAGFDYVVNPFVITGATDSELEESRALIRRHVSYYAATRTYFAVLEHHGWVDVGHELVALSRAGRWDDMPALVTDEMLAAFAIEGRLEELPDRLAERYGGVATTVNLVFGPPYPELQERQRRLFEGLRPIMDALRAVA